MRSLSRAGGIVAMVAFAVTGCGGGSKQPVASSTLPANVPARQQIEKNWIAFFRGSTSADEKAKLLENGDRFASLIEAQAGSPLAKSTKATVASVQPQGATRANVVFTIWLAGKPALKHQVGLAVRAGNVWQVSARSFCALLALQGQVPAACPKR